MKKNTILILLLGAAVLTPLLMSCEKSSLPESISAQKEARYGGTLVIGIPRDVDTFNPLFSESVFSLEILHLMLLGMADLDAASQFQPELAASWKHSDDNLSLTYQLRKGAVWSDGVPVTAEDVAFTFDLIMDTLVASPKRDIMEFVTQVSVLDSYTVKIEFSQPYPYQIFDTAGELLPKHMLQNADRKSLRSHEFGRNPLSSGPFLLKEWKQQQYIELVANDKYFGGRPYLDRVIFKIVPDKANLMTQLQTGEVDMVINLPPGEANQLKETNPNIRLYAASGRVYHYLGYNHKNSLFSSPEVRKALNMAVNRQGMIDALLYGFGRPCFGHIPPLIARFYNNTMEGMPHHTEKAKEVLAGEGWQDSDGDGWLDKNGNPFKFNLLVEAANQTKKDAAIIIQDQLKKIGVAVVLKPLEWSVMLKELKKPTLDAWIGGWSTSLYVDPTPVFHSEATKWFNYGSYSNSYVDQLIESGREEVNEEKAAETWKEFQSVLYEDQPYAFLYWVDRIVAVNERFHNVTPIPLSALYNLEKWYMTEEAAAAAE